MIIKKGQVVKVISDLHIYSDFETSSFFYEDEDFLEKLKELTESCDVLILNGDVFETYISEKRPSNKEKVKEVKKIVYESYAKSFEYIFQNPGKIFFTVGNHDHVLSFPNLRREIFGKDCQRLNFFKKIILKFEPKDGSQAGYRTAVVTHGNEPYYENDDLISSFKRYCVEVFWWIATIALRKKGVLNPAAQNSVYTRGEVFNKRNVENIKEQFRYSHIDCLVLGHTHKPVIMPLSYEDNGNTENFTYVNTGYFNGLENYVTSLVNTGGKIVVSQQYERDEDRLPSKTKKRGFLEIHPIFDWYARKVF